MKFKNQLTFLIILSIVLVTVLVVDELAAAESSPYDLVVSGLVDRPFNFTYSELQKLPMISEVALIQCIADFTEIYNWTGIPIFFILNMTGVKAGAREVVFYASDGFSSSLTIERALHPTTILALQANGMVLSQDNGYPYRLVVPCKYGYKWVGWITEIEVVDYDYKGTYESAGESDEAEVPNCALPSTTPPFEILDVFMGFTNHSVIALSNSTINSLNFDASQKQVGFTVSGPQNTTGYFYGTISKKLLWCDDPEEWQVWVNNTIIKDRRVMEVNSHTYVYFTFNQSTQEVKIIGTFSASPPNVVGGIYIPVNKPELLVPYMELAALLAVGVLAVFYFKKRKRRID